MHKYRINDIFQYLTESKKKQIRSYFDLLVKWNKKINLISSGTLAEADIIHLADGIYGSEIIYKSKPASPIYDLGSGNGIPGIVFSILYNDIKIICVDSDQRKSAFLMAVKAALGLNNLEVKNMRVSEIKENPPCFMARGFSSIDESLAEIEKFKTKQTRFFHFKTHEWSAEAQQCSTWNNFALGQYTLKTDAEEIRRVIVESKPI